MSYETPEQKALLLKVEQASATCNAAGVNYGKALSALNQGYGHEDFVRAPRSPIDPEVVAGLKQNIQRKIDTAWIKRISRMTFQQVRDAQSLPAEMAAMGEPSQKVGEVFTDEQLAKVAPSA